LFVAYGQFLDHDITLNNEALAPEIPIEVPAGDPFLDPFNTGRKKIPFRRSIATRSRRRRNEPRQQINFLSGWVDGSQVY